jgi:hypothetical protein
MPTTHKIALIAPVDGLTPFSLVASDVDKKLDSVTLGAGLDYGSGGILSLIPSEIDHDSLLNVHQDVNTDASPVFAGATIGSVAIPGVFTAMTEPTGFVDRVATISWSDATYTLTITGNHDIYINGVKTTKTTASIQITDATGLYYIYYNAAGTLTSSTVHPGFALPLMATVYWNTTTDKGLVGEERHGIKMDTDTHTLLHYTVGARYESGLAGTFADTTFSIAAGVIDDEDITLSIAPAKTTCNVLYKDGAAEFKWLAGQTKYYYEDGGSDLNYNNGNTLTPLAANKYMAVWIFATNDTTTPIVSLIGQRTDTTITDARNNNKYESLTLGTLPFQEMKLLYRVILQNTATPYVETQDLRNISNLPAGTYVATAHNVLTGLDYDSAGHTGFEPTVTKGNLTAGSTKITIGGTGTGALIGAGATVDVSEANVVHDNLSGFVANEHIDHTGVSVSAGTGMSGGGTIAANRTLDCTITQYTDTLARTACIAASISDGDLTHSPDGNSVFDALALKSPIASPTFTGTVTLPASTLIPDGGTIGQAAGPLLTFNDTSNYLGITGCNVGIGTVTPDNDFTLSKTVPGEVVAHIENLSAADSALTILRIGTPGPSAYIDEIITSSTYNQYPLTLITSSQAILVAGYASSFLFGTETNADLIFITGNNGPTGERMRILGTGKIGIGTNAPSQALDLIGSLELEVTTTSTTGVIYKGANSFIHNFQHPTGDTAVPAGYNTFVGQNAGNFTMGSTATETYHGSFNSAIGNGTLYKNTTGYYNVAIGGYSLYANTTGFNNIAIGYNSLTDNTTGYGNFALGFSSLYSNTTGYNNTAIGSYSGFVSTGSANIFLGYYAGRRQTVLDNLLIIDNQDRSSAAQEITNSLIYGVFAAAPENQTLRINAILTPKLHIDQSSTTAAIPVLTLDQGDVSEEFIRFIGTAADNVLTQSLVAVADVTTFTVVGYGKVYVVDDGGQIVSGPYYTQFGTIA